MRILRLVLLVFLLPVACHATPASHSGGEPPISEATRRNYMAKNPDADTNKDGALSATEMRDHGCREALANFTEPGACRHVMVPMRDGVRLATVIFMPKGDGPWPVVLMRTQYGRWSAAPNYSREFKNPKWKGVVLACQDLRGDGDSEGKGTFDPVSFDNEIDDSYDTVEWIAKQPWCDGNVSMMGNSGHGFAAYMAMLANPPHLRAVRTMVSGGNAYLYWYYHNGVPRKVLDWLSYRNASLPTWPKPSIRLFDLAAYERKVAAAAEKNDIAFISRTGWYDIFLESSLDYFKAFSKNGKVFVQIDPKPHAPLKNVKFPASPLPQEGYLPSFPMLVRGMDREELADKKSFICYYLMGDFRMPDAPGNVYKVTHEWPVPHKDVSFYLRKDGSATRAAPTDKTASLSYRYDPNDPVPSIGGGYYGDLNLGPEDQSPLQDRKDILRFETQPLAEPMEITGKIRAEIFISSDVPDTTFMVKLVDIYPDGYEAIVRDSAVMARFWKGLNNPAPIQKGKIYTLNIDLWSTALVFNKGHRIAVHVTSSNAPKYEVHPNSYEPVYSFENAPIANNTLHLDREHASRIILPVVKPNAR